MDKDQEQTYRGKIINVLREARQGDPGFDGSRDQVVIQYVDKNEDGTEMVVARSELSTS